MGPIVLSTNQLLAHIILAYTQRASGQQARHCGTKLLAVLVAFTLIGFGSYPTSAVITLTGDVNPSYPGSDPWVLDYSDAILSKEDLNVGDAGTGTLRIDGDSVIYGQSVYLGRKAGSDGSATVSGPDAVLDNSRSTVVASQGTGTLHIYDGGTVNSGDYRAGYIGAGYGSVGVATVSGAGSTWNNAGNLVIGSSGTGTLNLADGAAVYVDKDTIIREHDIGQGVIQFSGGELNTGGLMTAMADLLGSGTINTAGLVSDLDLVFDSSTGLQQQILLNSLPDQNITINIDAENPNLRSSLGAGYQGAGTLTVADGLNTHSEQGYLGYKSGSSGTVKVAGPGSAWAIDHSMYVGYFGTGTLRIEDGGTVSAGSRTLGHYGPDTHSAAIITGAGSVWSGGNLQVGTQAYGTGTLSIQNGGTVSAHTGLIMNGSATVTGPGSNWSNSLDLKVLGGNSLSILDGAHVSNINGFLGFDTYDDTEPEPEGSVTVTVSGVGSTWTNTGRLEVGHDSSQPGILRIENGGTVHVGQKTELYPYGNGDSAIIFNDGTLHTQSLLTNADQIRGSGMIHTTGLVSDLDVVFDATTGLTPRVVLNSQPGQNVTIHLDAADPSVGHLLGVGYRGGGSLTIKDGVVVTATTGYVGYNSWYDTATARVTGPGSAWHNTGSFSVGYDGFGALVVDQGGQVTSANGSIAHYEGSIGHVTVTDPGSLWEISGDLQISNDQDSSGNLRVENGGTVRVGGALSLGKFYSTGSLEVVQGGSVHVEGDLVLGGNRSSASLLIGSGGHVSMNGDLHLNSSRIPPTGDLSIYLAGGILDLNGNDFLDHNGFGEFVFTGGLLEGAAEINLKSVITQHGGTLAPGDGVGQTHVAYGYDLVEGTLQIQLGGDVVLHDLLSTHHLDINPVGTTLNLKPAGPIPAGTYTIVKTLNSDITGHFERITGIEPIPGLVDINYEAREISVTFHQDYVPEPVALWLIGVGAMCLGARRRRGSFQD